MKKRPGSGRKGYKRRRCPSDLGGPAGHKTAQQHIIDEEQGFFLELKLERKQKEKVAYLRDFLSGAEGNRTPVRKPIPCSSTIIVYYLTFPLPHGNRHSCGFSSFMIRPCTQSLVHVVSHIVDARFLMCECTKADSSH